MLEIKIEETELYDEANNSFIYIKEQTLQLEHSLVSLSKWESKWHKPYYSRKDKTQEEVIDYIRCMTLNKHADPMVYAALNPSNIKDIQKYIDDPMTAISFPKYMDKQTVNRDTMTSDMIYYWMITLNIPVEFQKWHLNRLIALINLCAIKNTPKKKRSQKELIAYHNAVNEANRKRFHSKG